MDDVALLHDVVLAFKTPTASFLGPSLASVCDEVVVGNDLDRKSVV